MRRRCWGSILPLCLALHSRGQSSSGNRCDVSGSIGRQDGGDETAAQRLVLSLGFEMQEMERLVCSFATGQKPQPTVVRGEDCGITSRVVGACAGQPALLLLMGKMTVAHSRMRDPSACGGEKHGVRAPSFEKSALDGTLRRSASRLKLDMRTWNADCSSSTYMQLCILTLLSAALRESLRGFRQEGKRRFQSCRGGDTEGIKQLQEWRYKVLCLYVEAFAAFEDAFRAALATPFKIKNDDSSAADDMEALCLCTSKVVAATFSIAAELQWHTLRPSVKTHGGEEVSLLEGRVKCCGSSVLQMASSLFEGVARENMSLMDDARRQQQQQQLLSRVLRDVEDILVIVETRDVTVEKGLPDEACIFLALMLWLLSVAGLIPSSLSMQLEVERQLISCFQRLWLRIAPPLERHADDKVMTHRTVHSSLNIRYARCRAEEGDGHSGVLLASHPSRVNLLLRLLLHTAKKFAAWQSTRGTTAPVSMVLSYAVLCRTLLEVETELYFLACKKTRCCWTIPTNIPAARDVDEVNDARMDSAWANVFRAASDVRVLTALLIRAYARAYASQDILAYTSTDEKDDMSFVQCPTYRFIKGITVSFLPLVRRHYLATEGKEVLTSCLQTFVALKQVSDVRDGDGEERRRKEKTAFRVCGVSLSQAAEVAFFLSLQRQACEASLCGGFEGVNDQMDGFTVSSYVKEVFFALDHNTAKQLWHLRARKAQHCFTGVQCGEVSASEPLLRRQTHSVLAVVHAHVVHPSFLWMPLQQLQEVVFMLSQNRELIESVQKGAKPSDTNVPGSPTVVRVGSLGGTLRHFSRALGYVALRLYVVSNVLRNYYLELRKQERPSRLHLENSASEMEKCRRRRWARNMALILHDTCSGMTAEVEGLDPKQLAHRREAKLRVFKRLQFTIHLAVRHSLLFHVKKQRRLQRSKQMVRRTYGGTEAGHPAAEAAAVPELALTTTPLPRVLTLHLERAGTTTPLGFSLYGDRATIRRIAGVGSKDAAGGGTREGTTPFILALRAAGVADPHTIVGWRVLHVDGNVVESSSAIIRLVNGKRAFSMTICST